MTDQSSDILSHMAAKGAPALMNRDREMIPVVLLRAMLILALSSLALVSYAVLTDRPLVGQPLPAEVTAERMIVLERAADGAMSVRTPDGTTLAEPGEATSGFIDVVWRAMARQRMQHAVDPTAPLALRERANGRLELTDPETGWSVELASFGADNRRAFAALLD
jgi:putative photosynthetic complex assembly protein